MIESAVICEIGKANEVILGFASVGSDLDGSWVQGDFEFLPDDWSGPSPD